MKKDKLIIIKRIDKDTYSHKRVRVNNEAYNKLRELATASGQPLAALASTLVNFAYDRVELIDADKVAGSKKMIAYVEDNT